MKFVYCKTCLLEVPVEDGMSFKDLDFWPACELCGAKNWVLPGEPDTRKLIFFISDDDPSIH